MQHLASASMQSALSFLDKSSFFPYLYLCTDRCLLPRTLALFVKARCVAVRSCNGEGGCLMPSVLLIDPIPAPFVERLGPLFPPGAPLDIVSSYSEEDLARHATATEILLVIQREVDARLRYFLPRVRFIQRVAVAYDNLDLNPLQPPALVPASTPVPNALAD